jgi:hypothetical protein
MLDSNSVKPEYEEGLGKFTAGRYNEPDRWSFFSDGQRPRH